MFDSKQKSSRDMSEAKSVQAIRTAVEAIQKLEADRWEKLAALRRRHDAERQSLSREAAVALRGIDELIAAAHETENSAQKIINEANISVEGVVVAGLESAPLRILVPHAGESLAKLADLAKELIETPRLRREWRESIAAFRIACDDAESAIATVETEAILLSVERLKAARQRATIALNSVSDEPAKKADFEELVSRVGALMYAADTTVLRQKLRKEWLFRVEEVASACDALETVVCQGAAEVKLIESRMAEIDLRLTACQRAAEEYGCDGEDADRHRAIFTRVDNALVSGAKAVRRSRRRERAKKIGWVCVVVLILAAAFHYALLTTTTLSMVLTPSGDTSLVESGVDILWNGRVVQTVKGPVRIETSVTFDCPHLGDGTLEVQSADFDPVKRTIRISYGENRAGVFILPRSMQVLSVECDAPDVAVTVRKGVETIREFKGTASLRLPTGTYVVRAEKGFSSRQETVRVESSRIASVNMAMPRGLLRLSGRPAASTYTLRRGARVVVDNGQLPASLSDLPEGDYVITFVFQGETIARETTVAAGRISEMIGILPFGGISISTTGSRHEPTFALRRSGSQAIESSGTAPATIQEVHAGTLEVEVADGPFVMRKQVSVNGDRNAPVSFDFKYGKVHIETIPSGAEVEFAVDGQQPFVRKSPVDADNIPEGDYLLTFRYAGAAVTEPLSVRANHPQTLSRTLPVGKVRIAGGKKSAYFTLRTVDNSRALTIVANESQELPSGDYLLEAMYSGIASWTPVRVEIGGTVTVDPFAKTSSVRFVANIPGSRFTLSPSEDPSGGVTFSVGDRTPSSIDCLPWGAYSIRWTAPSVATQNETVKIDAGTREVRYAFRRNVHDISEKDFDYIDRFDVVSEKFLQPYADVWRAVYEELKAPLQRKEEPYRVASDRGYMISKRLSFSSNLSLAFNIFAGHTVWFDHTVVITDMFDHVDVQVVTEIWNRFDTPDNPLHPSYITTNWEPVFDQQKSKVTSSKFLEAVRKRLARK